MRSAAVSRRACVFATASRAHSLPGAVAVTVLDDAHHQWCSTTPKRGSPARPSWDRRPLCRGLDCAQMTELAFDLSAIAAPPGLPRVSDMVTAAGSQIGFEYGAGLLDRVQSALRRPLPELQHGNPQVLL